MRLELPGLHEFFLEKASEAQLAIFPPEALFEAQSVAAPDPDLGRERHPLDEPGRPSPAGAFSSEPATRSARPRRTGRWVLTQFPTAATPPTRRMTLPEYEDFVIAGHVPRSARPAGRLARAGAPASGPGRIHVGRARSIRIEADGTDLTLSVAGRTWINSDGKRNMPSGEIFTGPVEDSATGRLRCGFPVCRDGRELVGINLEFREGQVVSAQAPSGEDYLLAMLDLDPGARRLGELGLGLNSGIDRFTGSILYDEKIGGTVHLALGQSYPETGGVNKSALHWDLIVDTRTDGRITADGRLVMENGQWLVG